MKKKNATKILALLLATGISLSTAMPVATAITTPTTPVQTVATQTVSDLTSVQRESLNMLNYLAYLTKEINESKNNRLYVEAPSETLEFTFKAVATKKAFVLNGIDFERVVRK